jgi:hypothetical protein
MGLGKVGLQMRSLLGRDARGKHVRATGQQGLEYPLQRADRLPLAINHFGVAAATAAIEIDLGFVQIGRGGLGRFEQEIGKLEPAGEQLSGQILKAFLVHSPMVA